jgi:AraC-like DNA-binding protein
MSTAIDHIQSINFWHLNSRKKFHIEHIRSIKPSLLQQIVHPHKIEFYAIRWIKQGEGIAHIDHIPIKICPNLMFMGNPSQITWYEIDEPSKLDIYVIAFRPEFLALMNLGEEATGMLERLTTRTTFHPNAAETNIIDRFIALIESEFNDTYIHHHQDVLAPLVKAMLAYIFRIHFKHSITKEYNQGYINIYRDFLQELNQHYKTHHKVKEYAHMMFKSEKQINRALKTISGYTAGEIINQRLDLEAQRLLFYTTKSIKEIAYELGFHDATHLNKFFRNIHGLSPGKYREISYGQEE